MNDFARQEFIPGRNPLLELCPFCGEPGEMQKGEEGIIVKCSSGECPFKPVSVNGYATEEEAIKAWNTRKGGGIGNNTPGIFD